jgi:hypothetical protein
LSSKRTTSFPPPGTTQPILDTSIAGFIGSEIYLRIENADEFLAAIDAIQGRQLPSWAWHGNSHSVHLTGNGCTISDHYPDMYEGQQARVELSLDDFKEILLRLEGVRRAVRAAANKQQSTVSPPSSPASLRPRSCVKARGWGGTPRRLGCGKR